MSRHLAGLVLAVSILGCGGGDGGGGGGGGGPGSRLVFLADFTHGKVAAFDEEPSGTRSPARLLEGLPGPEDIAYDAGRDELYVALGGYADPAKVVVYTQASTRSGSATPARTIALGAGWHPTALCLDTAADVLYVAAQDTYSDGEIRIFERAHTRTGSTAPERTIALGSKGVTDIAVDPGRGRLYALSQGWGGVFLVTGLATANGAVDGVRIYSGNTTSGLALDPVRDRLYVTNWGYTDPTKDGVVVLEGVSAATDVLTGTLVPVPGAERIDLDAARDDLYVLAYSKVTILRAIGTTAPASLDREGWEGAEAVFLRGAAFGP